MKKTWQEPALVIHGDAAELTLGCIITKQSGAGDDLSSIVEYAGGTSIEDCPTS